MKSFVFLLGILATPAVLAQQGHPLEGIWLGDWGPDTDSRNYVVLEMHWMDTSLSGIINPGFPDAATIEAGGLNSSDWTVHLEAVGKDETGKDFRTIIDGQIEDLGSPKRSIHGTWKQGMASGDFTLTRE